MGTELEQAEKRFHIDGPHTDDDTREAARVLAHLVRYLNHATLPHRAEQSLEYPSTVSTVVDQLGTAAAGLVQLTEQLRGRLELLGEDANTYDDGMGKRITSVPADRAAAVRAAWGAQELAEARDALAGAAAHLEAAFKQTDRLGYREAL